MLDIQLGFTRFHWYHQHFPPTGQQDLCQTKLGVESYPCEKKQHFQCKTLLVTMVVASPD